MFELVTLPWSAYRAAQLVRAHGREGGQTSWQLAGSVVGVIGPDRIINAMIRYGTHLAKGSTALNEDAAAEIVALAQARVPQLTGLLHDGIEAVRDGNTWIVRAQAQKYSNTKDYAKDVEFGTAAGKRGRRVVTDDYFAGPYAGRTGSINEETGRRRRVHDARRIVARDHPGTDPQPYFLPAVQEVLERRNARMEALQTSAAAEADL